MQFPDNWSTSKKRTSEVTKGSNKRVKKTSSEEKAVEPPPPNDDIADISSTNDVYKLIQERILRYQNHCNEGSRGKLEIDTVLSKIPYKAMMEHLFNDDSESCSNPPVVTKAYEELFMREPIGKDERACVMGSNCECMFIDPKLPFVGVEFLLPAEKVEDEVKMCVLCCRKTTKQLFQEMLLSNVYFRGVIQRYGNICNLPNEYAKEALLFCPPNKSIQCMPLPVVDHQRNRYRVKIHNGNKYITQHRVCFEDFH